MRLVESTQTEGVSFARIISFSGCVLCLDWLASTYFVTEVIDLSWIVESVLLEYLGFVVDGWLVNSVQIPRSKRVVCSKRSNYVPARIRT